MTDRVRITRVDPDGVRTPGTAQLLRDPMSRSILGVADPVDHHGRYLEPPDAGDGELWVHLSTRHVTGEVPIVGPI